MNLKTLVKLSLSMLFVVVMLSGVSFAQLSTVYVDITNGSDTYTGANATNSPAGSGPVASINKGLSLLADNGKLVIFAGTYNGGNGAGGNVNIATATYSNLKTGLTIELRSLNSNQKVDLTGGNFVVNVINGTVPGTLTVTTTSGTEYLNINSGNMTLTAGNVNIGVASSVRLVTGGTLTVNGTSSFTNQAPQKGTDLNLTYTGDGSFTAGPEGSYGNYGAGIVTVNKTAGTTVTFNNAFTFTGSTSITLQSGNATFASTITAGVGDILNTGAGALTFNGNVDFSISNGVADANLGSVENSNAGTITFNNPVTWTAATTIGALAFPAGATTYIIDNSPTANTGAITFNNTLTFNAPNNTTGNNVSFTALNSAVNGGLGKLTLGTVSAPKSGSNNYTMTLSVTNSAATPSLVTLAGGELKGTLTNSSTGTFTVSGNSAVGGSVVNSNSGTFNLAGGTIAGALTNSGTGTVNVNGATSVSGVFTNAKTVALGVNTLTLKGNVAHLTNGGTVTASTGGILVTATGANSFDGGTLGNLTITNDVLATTTTLGGAVTADNVTVTAGTLNVNQALTVNNTTTVSGGSVTVQNFKLQTKNFSQTGGAFSLNANAASILDVKGDLNRTDGTFTAGAASIVSFTGTTAQSFNGGPLLQVADLTFTNTTGTISLGQSVRVTGTATISGSTNVALGTLNIILFANNAAIINNGTYSATGGGGVIFGGVNTIANAAANYTGQTIAGTGVYSYITVDVGSANAVTMASAQNVKFNGVLRFTSGDLNINNAGGSFGPTGTAASVIRDVVNSTKGVYITAGGFDTDSPVNYDLTYNGTLAGDVTVTIANVAGGAEFTAANVRNLTISTESATSKKLILSHTAAVTVNGNLSLTTPVTSTNVNEFNLPAQNLTVKGALSVALSTLISGGNAANSIILSGDSQPHSVVGKITAASLLTVTGAGSTLTGSTATAADAEVANLYFEPAADGATFTSTILKKIAGDLTIQGTSTKTGASATVTMNSTSATLSGNLNVGNGTTIPTASVTIAGSSTCAHSGAINLTNGNLTYTRNSKDEKTAAVTLTAGTLNLGSSITVLGATSQVAGNINLGSYTYTQAGSVATPDYNRTGAGTVTGTGKVLFDATAAAIDVTPGATFSIPNVEVKGAGNGVVFSGPMTVNGALTHTSGAFDMNVLTFAGNSYTFTAGTVKGTLNLTGSAPTMTLAGDYAITAASTFGLNVNTDGNFTLASSKVVGGVTQAVTQYVTDLTQTKGNVVMGINNINVAGAFDRSSATAGTWSQSSGYLVFNTATAFKQGASFSIDNLEVVQSVSANPLTTGFTVAKNLVLDPGAVLTINAGKLTLGDDILVERKKDDAKLSSVPTFAGVMSVKYSTTAGINTAGNFNELPTTVKNFTIVTPATVTLPKSITVTNTLTLGDVLTNATTKNITMADNSTLVLKNVGTTVISTVDLVKAGTMHIVYDGATATSSRELGATSPTAGNVTILATSNLMDLHANATFTGLLKFDGGNLDLNGKTLNVQGDVTETSNAGFFVPGVAGTAGYVVFSGSNQQTLTLKTTRIVDADVNITINKTNLTDKVTLAGGDLDFATNSKTLTLTKGLLVTNANNVILKQSSASNQPVQGFARTDGSVVGNVKKFIDKTATVDISRVEFPTGTLAGEYRPFAAYFKTSPQNSINMTVNHINAKAGGNNGFPITAGTKQITNYPAFSWYVKSDISLAPSYKYDMDAMAEGYTDYTKDQIQNVRFVRRDSGNVNNQWVMQGADNFYDNSTVSLTKPVVKVIDAQGGITTQGSLFSYSQSNKAPVFTSALVNQAVSEGDTVKGTYASTDPDFNQTVTLSSVTLPTGATFDASTGKVNWIVGYDLATKTNPTVTKSITIRSTDNMGAYRDTTVTITVNNKNRLPVVAKMGTVNVAENVAYSYQYAATDADGETVSYTMNVAGDATLDSAKISTTGLLTWTPGFGNAGKTVVLNVNATDGIGTTTVSDTIKVTKTNRAPVFTVKVDTATIPMGSAYTANFTATDPDGNTIAYSVTGDDSTASINAATGVFTWTPAYKTTGGVYNFTVKATDNGSPALSVTTAMKLTVTWVNAAPVFTATLPTDTIAVGDTVKFQYKATDANNDVLTYGLLNAPLGASINTATGLFTWIPQATQTAIYVIKATVTDGKIATPVVTSKEVLVKVVTVAVSGKVSYYNTTKGVAGVEVTLTPTSGTALKATTDANGNYTINNVNAGTYTIKGSKTTAAGSINAGDALLAALYSVDATANPLSDVQKLAADANGSTTINASDASLIVQKFVDATTVFPAGNWAFKTDGTVNVASKAVTSNITAIAVGDVNGSYGNGTIAKNAFSISTSDEQKVAPKATFTLPIKVAEDAKLGSASVQFTYPADLVKFEGVIGAEGMVCKDVNGTVTLAWFNTKGMSLKAGEVLAGLKFSATEKFAKGQSFSVSVDNSTEFTDVKGQPMSLALSVANVTCAVPQAFALNQNYPNPFNPTTTIAYDLPVDGKVTLAIYNSIGELVSTLVNEVQTAGSYKFNWNASNMASGVYLYRITVEGQKAYSSTQKMILMK